jgi:DNA-binding GntR family transcriptional regulator
VNAPALHGTAQRIVEEIRSAILEGRWRAGDPLREAQIAEDFGVSRTPVRQALRQLEREGLVLIRPNRGAVVNAMGREALLEIAEVRSHLSILAARRVTARATDADLDTLEELAGRIETAIELRATDGAKPVSDALMAFHRAFFRMSGNALLSRLFETTTFVHVVAATFQFYSEEDWARISVYPSEFLYALRERDAELAAALVSAYFRQARSAIGSAFPKS